MRFQPFALSATLAAVAAAGQAADTQLNDLRLVAGFWPQNYEASPGGSIDTIDSAGRIGVDYIRSWGPLKDIGGWIYGGEFAITGATGKKAGVEDTDNTVSIDALGGYAYALPSLPQLWFEGKIFLGIGQSKFTEKAGGVTTDDTGGYWEFGLGAGAFYAFNDRWSVGLDLRFLIQSKTSIDLGGGSVDVKDDGLGVLAVGGYRF